jgi:hypothetical protein
MDTLARRREGAEALWKAGKAIVPSRHALRKRSIQ